MEKYLTHPTMLRWLTSLSLRDKEVGTQSIFYTSCHFDRREKSSTKG
jgi:hypothetical protein